MAETMEAEMNGDEFYHRAYEVFLPITICKNKFVDISRTMWNADISHINFVVFFGLYYSDPLKICVWPTTLKNEVETYPLIEVPIEEFSWSEFADENDIKDADEIVEKAMVARFYETWQETIVGPLNRPYFFCFHDRGEYLDLETGEWLNEREQAALVREKLRVR